MKILICIDAGGAAGHVLKEAAKVLAGFRGAEVHVFTVLDMAMIAAQTDYSNTVIMETLEREAARLFNEATEILGEKAFIFSKHVGSPVDEILEKAREINADLIIMGTHGRTGINHLLVGSVAEKVIRESLCAVLIVPVKNKSEE